MSLLSVRNLSINFTANNLSQYTVKNISFDLQSGRTLALVGSSGSGKTVTALSILKLIPDHEARYPSGQIYFQGKNLLELSERQIQTIRGKEISMIFQEPMTALNPLHSIKQQIAEGVLIHNKVSISQAYQRTDELLSLVGLNIIKDRLNLYPHELSGGQRQRVMIAMSLANNPQILIADEPTTALDVTTQAGILKLLTDLQQQLNLAILLISHDLHVVQQIAHDVCIMNQGEIIEHGVIHTVLNHPQNPYTKALINAEPNVMVESRNSIPSVLFKAKEITVNYKTKRKRFAFIQDNVTIVNKVSFNINAGQTLGIVGESGSGKTTLAHALLNLMPYQGEFYYQNEKLNHLNSKQFKPYRRLMQLVFQDPYSSLNPRFMVRQILQEGLDIHMSHLSSYDKYQQVLEALNDVGLSETDLLKYPHQFSGGQRQRIALARVLILKPKLIILDEPTSALDRLIQKDILKLLVDTQIKYNLSYILISHNLSVIRAMAHHILVLQAGHPIEYDKSEKIVKQPQHSYTRELITTAFYKDYDAN